MRMSCSDWSVRHFHIGRQYHFSVKIPEPSTIFMMIFSNFGRFLEESSCTCVYWLFIAYLPSKMEAITTKRLKQTEYVTEMLVLR